MKIKCKNLESLRNSEGWQRVKTRECLKDEDAESEDEYGTPVWIRKLEAWAKQKTVQYIIQEHLNNKTTEILKDNVATYNTELLTDVYAHHSQEDVWKLLWGGLNILCNTDHLLLRIH